MRPAAFISVEVIYTLQRSALLHLMTLFGSELNSTCECLQLIIFKARVSAGYEEMLHLLNTFYYNKKGNNQVKSAKKNKLMMFMKFQDRKFTVNDAKLASSLKFKVVALQPKPTGNQVKPVYILKSRIESGSHLS